MLVDKTFDIFNRSAKLLAKFDFPILGAPYKIIIRGSLLRKNLIFY